jgi:hypothetical protein
MAAASLCRGVPPVVYRRAEFPTLEASPCVVILRCGLYQHHHAVSWDALAGWVAGYRSPTPLAQTLLVIMSYLTV